MESEKYIKDLPSVKFVGGDIEELNIEKADLIISSSVFQWIKDKDKLFEKISRSTDTLVFSIYIKGNLMEISDHFGISLEYLNMEELKSLLNSYFKNIKGYEEEFTLEFDTPMKGLKHLKNTGVTGIGQTNIKAVMSARNIGAIPDKELREEECQQRCMDLLWAITSNSTYSALH